MTVLDLLVENYEVLQKKVLVKNLRDLEKKEGVFNRGNKGVVLY